MSALGKPRVAGGVLPKPQPITCPLCGDQARVEQSEIILDGTMTRYRLVCMNGMHKIHRFTVFSAAGRQISQRVAQHMLDRAEEVLVMFSRAPGAKTGAGILSNVRRFVKEAR